MSIKLIYKDVAVGADIGASVTTPEAESFSRTDRILKDDTAPAIATLEHNSWGLTHDYKLRDNQRLAFWSTQISTSGGAFSTYPQITIDFPDLITSTGVSIRFAPALMEYCDVIEIAWYRDSIELYSSLYFPKSPLFAVDNPVENFNKITFVFLRTNQSLRRLKIESITIGVIREIDSTELTSLSAIHEIDPISSTAPSNVLDASIHSYDDIEYIFQRKQPVEAYDGDELIGVYYIEKGKRVSGRDYRISCQDTIGLLELMSQGGGIWFEDTPLTDILMAIFGETVDFEIDPAFKNSTLRGYIPAGTMRSALQQIAFALGAVVDTTGARAIKIFPLPAGDAHEISADKTYTGGSVDTANLVTEATVTAYVIFDERPESGDLFIEHNGVKYRYYTDTKHAVNNDAPKGAPENKKKFDKMYLCNNSNAQTLANKIMAYYQRRNTYAFKHVLGGQVPAGRYEASLPWGGAVSGNIRKMTITMSGLNASSTEMLLDK